MNQGRDIGKIKKEGYLRGTQASRWRGVFIGAVLAWTCGYGFYKVYSVDWESHRIYKFVDWVEQQREEHEKKKFRVTMEQKVRQMKQADSPRKDDEL